jgi:hypothetical protein
MIATIYPDNSPFALAHPQAGHAALAAVQVYPRFGDSLGIPNRIKTRLSGNGWFLPTLGTGALGLTAVQASPVRGRPPCTGIKSPTHRGIAGQGNGQQCFSAFLASPAPQTGPAVLATPGSRFGDSIPVQGDTSGTSIVPSPAPQVGPVALAAPGSRFGDMSGTFIGLFNEKEGGMLKPAQCKVLH